MVSRDGFFAALAGKGVGFHREAVDPGGADGFGGGGEFLAAGTVDEGDGGPGLGEFEGAAQAYAAGSAGDDGDLVLQFHGGRTVTQGWPGRKR